MALAVHPQNAVRTTVDLGPLLIRSPHYETSITWYYQSVNPYKDPTGCVCSKYNRHAINTVLYYTYTKEEHLCKKYKLLMQLQTDTL